eukprot:727366-Alexandrium_andersonii.AAC.1
MLNGPLHGSESAWPTQEEPCEPRRLLRLDLQNGGLRLSPILRRGEGRLARWARWDRRPLGLDFGSPSSL